MLVVGFHDYDRESRTLAQHLEVPWASVETHRFPDGEIRLRLPPELPSHLVLCRSLNRPNAKLVELMLAAETARRLGVRRLTLVAPYLCYMRQDAAFTPGEAVSQTIVGRFLAGLFDDVITVDPHLHRVSNLAQAVPVAGAAALSAAPLLSAFLRTHRARALLLGPDEESAQWVGAIAHALGMDFAVAHKERHGDSAVRIILPKLDVQGRTVVIVDDMISTGHTAAHSARALYARGAAEVDVLVTHALFSQGATRCLTRAGIRKVWSTDSVDHPSNVISLAPLLAEAVRGLARPP